MPKATSKTLASGRQVADVRTCRLHDLVVRDATGHSRAFRFGERVQITAALADALGSFLDQFDTLAMLDPQAPLAPFTTTTADDDVVLPPGTEIALVDPAHEE